MPDSFRDTAEKFYFPIAEKISAQLDNFRLEPFFLGVNGCQGSGKSTLSLFLSAYFSENSNISVAVLSLDDFYFSRSERNALSVKISPLLATRGVPGTHDTERLKTTLASLKKSERNIPLPRFDKATDDPCPSETWPVLKTAANLVIMEGWCWGVASQEDSELANPVNQLEAEKDALGVWRNYVNQALRNDYEPLYNLMDYWVMLKAPSFDNVYQWRCEQEHKLKAKIRDNSETRVMSDEQVLAFIQYYQRLTQHGLATLPEKCDIVLGLDANRVITPIKGL